VKIDIHTHTRQCKTGDAPTREISPVEFCEKVQSTEVGIIAVTNHNVFDLDQYNRIVDEMDGKCQVWPGIELDVEDEEGNRGHLLVIVSPSMANELSTAVNNICDSSTPDTFITTIQSVLLEFEKLKPLYVAHYKQKKPSITENALEKLISGANNPSRVVKEVTNSIAAGIYISHGHASIYGSDVHDWSTYQEQARLLPDLRLPVESFEHFCLLLEKDPTTINTVLDQKYSENIALTPFDDNESISLRIFNDINVVFGPKGTGKSCILRSLEKHYIECGIDVHVYESASDKLDELFDTKGTDLSIILRTYDIDYCKDEIHELRNLKEVGVTSLSKFVNYFQTVSTNKNAKLIRLKDIEPEESGKPKREFNQFNDAAIVTSKFQNFINTHDAVGKVLDKKERNELNRILEILSERLLENEWNNYSEWKEIKLLNSAIEKLRIEIERKTGSPAKPTTTGFREYARNRMKAELNALKIVDTLDTDVPDLKEPVGSLGSEKGELELVTVLKFQNGTISDSSLKKLKSVNKSSQKTFSNKVRKILSHAYTSDLFSCIGELNDVEGVEDIETVYELIQFKRYFSINGKPYNPSSGEASMVMLHKELETEREIYILDEPERSLGNEYINDVIVPLIEARARAGKRIIISTHDANIAVRTLPYCSIYRNHGSTGYSTFVGNPFSNNLVNTKDDSKALDWKKISMKTLEGGVEAFGERGRIYGNY